MAPRLVRVLEDVFPGSAHVRDVGLARAGDSAVWAHAVEQDLAIVSKDSDFHQRSVLAAPPPKVIWIRLGNCTTDDIAKLLREKATAIQLFGEDPEAAFLALG